MRNKIFGLLACSIACGSILLTMYAMSPISNEIYRANFKRAFLYNAVEEKSAIDLKYNSFYFAGLTNNTIYLGNYSAPFHLLSIDTTLTDTVHVDLHVKLDSVAEMERFKLSVHEPYFFLFHGTMPKVFRGRVGEWIASDVSTDSSDFFVEALPVSKTSYITRAYNELEGSYEIGKSVVGGPTTWNNNLLRKQLDGIFCLDGQLLFDEKNHSFVYMHYYRNELVGFDSTLALKYRTHTIDTFSHARIKVDNVGQPGKSMLSRPPMSVNGFAVLSNRYLYVRSMLMASNEDVQQFLTKAVIDVYEIGNGKYVNSIYIPYYNDQPPREMRVIGDQIFVVAGRNLIKYKIHFNQFEAKMPLN